MRTYNLSITLDISCISLYYVHSANVCSFRYIYIKNKRMKKYLIAIQLFPKRLITNFNFIRFTRSGRKNNNFYFVIYLG